MSKLYSGGCACGQIRYETSADPIVELHCQCRECQRRSGTGHSSYLTFGERAAAVDISGDATQWRVAGDSGNDKIHAFCPTCGSPVYLTFAAMPNIIAIHAASLDDPSLFKPQAVTYNIRGHAWDTIDPSLAIFETMPPA
ncbi:GFA family protein [Rhizobium sp. Root1220]|uniref:GFA family protein n=1 Tax=Rhizobium sp. Root1220 TaxID=1736432 RepID=UPI0006FCB783|nr:GFA family protein [Rhizobium sp. Root1220]KQV68118.1 aldehyde-activating protein [Rhizobium sp. Root1220]